MSVRKEIKDLYPLTERFNDNYLIKGLEYMITLCPENVEQNIDLLRRLKMEIRDEKINSILK